MMCDQYIRGDRRYCVSDDGHDLDYCFKCYWTVEKTHDPTHVFAWR